MLMKHALRGGCGFNPDEVLTEWVLDIFILHRPSPTPGFPSSFTVTIYKQAFIFIPHQFPVNPWPPILTVPTSLHLFRSCFNPTSKVKAGVKVTYPVQGHFTPDTEGNRSLRVGMITWGVLTNQRGCFSVSCDWLSGICFKSSVISRVVTTFSHFVC